MQIWFECKVKYVKVDQDGRERKVSEWYLIDAVSFTDAEARMIEQMQQLVRGGEFQIDNIKKSNIIDIFPHEDGEFWFKAKISLVTIDEKAGKEKKITNYFLVAADDLKQAQQRLDEDLSYILVPITNTALALSPIVDVFPYTKEENNKLETQARNNLPSKDENPNGLHKRYIIAKADGKQVDERAEYFVLRLDPNGSDKNHISACQAAALTYADKIEPNIPLLAKDLRSKVEAYTKDPKE